ncbi:unnamed protein product [Calypogeia fissa]
MACPLLLSSRLSFFPSSSFTSAAQSATSSSTSAFSVSSSSTVSVSSSSTGEARGALFTTNSAAAPISPRKNTAATASVSSGICTRSFTRRVTRNTSYSVREHRLTKEFNGAPVPVVPVSSARTTTRRCASSTGSARANLVQKVTANELDSILSAERTSPMIIDFYATWCGPCVVLAQELEQLAVEYGQDIRFLKVDTDEEHELASQMEIRGLPTMVFVSKDVDKLAIRTEGLLPTNAIRDIIEKEILV